MAKHLFTPEQIDKLRQNPNTSSVSQKQIRFKPSFRKLFREQLDQGKKPEKIFIANGYDPEVLGKERISRFTTSIKKEDPEHLIEKAKLQARREEMTRQILLDRLKRVEYRIDQLTAIMNRRNGIRPAGEDLSQLHLHGQRNDPFLR